MISKYGKQGVPTFAYHHLTSLHKGLFEDCFIYDVLGAHMELLMKEANGTIVVLMGDHGGWSPKLNAQDLLLERISPIVKFLVPDGLLDEWGIRLI
jgi:hypothetical protein